MTQVLLPIDRPDAWPARLISLLDSLHELLLDSQIAPTKVNPPDHDRAILAVGDALRPYSITGWHCTRLTDIEIAQIVGSGMQLPDDTMLRRRINALVKSGRLPGDIGDRLARTNQADESNRAGRLWFCFFPPHRAGEHGIGRFFRHSGGEALYNSHEDDPVTSQILCAIGTPCVIEADVPVTSLAPGTGVATKLVRTYLISRGYGTHEPVKHVDRSVQPIVADCIRQVIRYPETDFMELTGCATWRRPPLDGQ
ncbi:hypothetical protein [Paraburkholderia phenazinium]|uniref:Uncharacterized protein n=1 Tax=Paraburkholderia phenazinium TaxID=60549 RepID=A0A1N6JBX4_9BURK|nr:hypothetical protein [Paraburkholderia phenazinium]SIO41629.1 hypothetical protein SAMN05444165_2985 [Paraburkholderia phenazinium]